jgi:hypothetical protein
MTVISLGNLRKIALCKFQDWASAGHDGSDKEQFKLNRLAQGSNEKIHYNYLLIGEVIRIYLQGSAVDDKAHRLITAFHHNSKPQDLDPIILNISDEVLSESKDYDTYIQGAIALLDVFDKPYSTDLFNNEAELLLLHPSKKLSSDSIEYLLYLDTVKTMAHAHLNDMYDLDHLLSEHAERFADLRGCSDFSAQLDSVIESLHQENGTTNHNLLVQTLPINAI